MLLLRAAHGKAGSQKHCGVPLSSFLIDPETMGLVGIPRSPFTHNSKLFQCFQGFKAARRAQLKIHFQRNLPKTAFESGKNDRENK